MKLSIQCSCQAHPQASIINQHNACSTCPAWRKVYGIETYPAELVGKVESYNNAKIGFPVVSDALQFLTKLPEESINICHHHFHQLHDLLGNLGQVESRMLLKCMGYSSYWSQCFAYFLTRSTHSWHKLSYNCVYTAIGHIAVHDSCSRMVQ